MKEYEDMTFQEIVTVETNKVLTEFVEKGGVGLRQAIYSAMNSAINWNIQQGIKKTEESKKKKNS